MSIKSVMLIFLLEEDAIPDRDIQAAVDFAAARGAHLTVAVGAPTFEASSGFLLADVEGMIREINERRRTMASTVEAHVRALAAPGEAMIRTEALCQPYHEIRGRLVALARVNDIVLMSRSDEHGVLAGDLAEELLFQSGRPLLMLPDNAALPAKPRRILVAWDGTARAARAVGDALPILAEADAVEILGVTGTEDERKALEGAEIAEHLARHCRAVTLTTRASPTGDIAAAIRDHMAESRADLLVTGGFAHSRLRHMVVGGVTSRMLAAAPFPVLLSY